MYLVVLIIQVEHQSLYLVNTAVKQFKYKMSTLNLRINKYIIKTFSSLIITSFATWLLRPQLLLYLGCNDTFY